MEGLWSWMQGDMINKSRGYDHQIKGREPVDQGDIIIRSKGWNQETNGYDQGPSIWIKSVGQRSEEDQKDQRSKTGCREYRAFRLNNKGSMRGKIARVTRLVKFLLNPIRETIGSVNKIKDQLCSYQDQWDAWISNVFSMNISGSVLWFVLLG